MESSGTESIQEKRRKKNKSINEHEKKNIIKKEKRKLPGEKYLDLYADSSEGDESLIDDTYSTQESSISEEVSYQSTNNRYLNKPVPGVDDDYEEEEEDSEDYDRQEYKYTERIGTAVPQSALLPTIESPQIFLIKCKEGRENFLLIRMHVDYMKYIKPPTVSIINNKPDDIINRNEHIFSISSFPGRIYIETTNTSYLKTIYNNMKFIVVPKKEYPEIFYSKTIHKIEKGDICLSKSLKQLCIVNEVHNDIAIIEDLQQQEYELTCSDLKLIKTKLRDKNIFYSIYAFLNIRINDRVKILSGELKNLIGNVKEIDLGRGDCRIEYSTIDGNKIIDIPMDCLIRDFRIGDPVIYYSSYIGPENKDNTVGVPGMVSDLNPFKILIENEEILECDSLKCLLTTEGTEPLKPITQLTNTNTNNQTNRNNQMRGNKRIVGLKRHNKKVQIISGIKKGIYGFVEKQTKNKFLIRCVNNETLVCNKTEFEYVEGLSETSMGDYEFITDDVNDYTNEVSVPDFNEEVTKYSEISNHTANKYTTNKYTTEKYETNKYTTEKYETNKYTTEKYETNKYTTEKYETNKYGSGKYGTEKYDTGKYDTGKYERFLSGKYDTGKHEKLQQIDSKNNQIKIKIWHNLTNLSVPFLGDKILLNNKTLAIEEVDLIPAKKYDKVIVLNGQHMGLKGIVSQLQEDNLLIKSENEEVIIKNQDVAVFE